MTEQELGLLVGRATLHPGDELAIAEAPDPGAQLRRVLTLRHAGRELRLRRDESAHARLERIAPRRSRK